MNERPGGGGNAAMMTRHQVSSRGATAPAVTVSSPHVSIRSLLSCALFLAGAVLSRGAIVIDPPVQYFLVLDGEPAAAVFLRVRAHAGTAAATTAARARAGEIRAQHDALVSRLTASNVVEIGRFCRLVNAIRVKATRPQLDALRALPGVREIQRVPIHKRQTASSVPFIGGPEVWGGSPAADGA